MAAAVTGAICPFISMGYVYFLTYFSNRGMCIFLPCWQIVFLNFFCQQRIVPPQKGPPIRTSLGRNFSMDKYIFSVWNPDTVQNKETKCCNKIHGVKENEMWWRLHLPWNGTPRTAKMIPKSFFQFEDPFSIKLGENCRRSKLQHTTYITTRHTYIVG